MSKAQQVSGADEDRPFQHYNVKHRMISWVSRTLFDRYTYTVRHGLLRGMKRKGGLGWLPEALTGEYETAEHRFCRQLNLGGLIVYDVGAFEGLRTMFFASRAKHVVCYEPNPRNFARLMTNLRLNDLRNVTVRNVGLGAAPQEIEMAWDPTQPGGASVEAAVAGSLRRTGSANVESIAITTLDLDRKAMKLAPPDLIKIDIEGWELEALRGACATLMECRPALYLEMHGETMREKKRKAAAIVQFLKEMGYERIEHVESGQRIGTGNSEAAAEGHLFAIAPKGPSKPD